MAEFVKTQGARRWTATIAAGDLTADFVSPGKTNVTFEFTGAGAVSHTVSGTGVEVKSASADESYLNETYRNLFTYAGANSLLITIDEEPG